MLDLIRKRAASIIVKVLFGAIIVVFIFFFGYNQISKKSGGGGGSGVVASVDGINISGSEYQLAYDNTYQMYQKIFKGKEDEPLPESIEKSVKATALRQLIQQKMIERVGKKIGAEPTKLELSKVIMSLPIAKNSDGEFDPILYKQRFLPYFSQKFNLNYEEMVKSDLLLNRVNSIFGSAGKAPLAKVSYNMENTKWTFAVIEFDTEDDAKLNKNGKKRTVDPITVSERNRVLPVNPGFEAWEKLFKLSINEQSEPIQSGEKWFAVKLTAKKEPTDKEWEKDKKEYVDKLISQNEQQFMQIWISSLMKDADVKTFINE